MGYTIFRHTHILFLRQSPFCRYLFHMFQESLRNKQLLRTEIIYPPRFAGTIPNPYGSSRTFWKSTGMTGLWYWPCAEPFQEVFGDIWIHTKCPPVVVYTPHEYYIVKSCYTIMWLGNSKWLLGSLCNIRIPLAPHGFLYFTTGESPINPMNTTVCIYTMLYH